MDHSRNFPAFSTSKVWCIDSPVFFLTETETQGFYLFRAGDPCILSFKPGDLWILAKSVELSCWPTRVTIFMGPGPLDGWDIFHYVFFGFQLVNGISVYPLLMMDIPLTSWIMLTVQFKSAWGKHLSLCEIQLRSKRLRPATRSETGPSC